MYFITFIIIALAVLFYIAMVRTGHLSFWKKAQKNPEFVFNQLLKDDTWVVDDGATKIDRKDYDGPFLLYVPSLGRTVKLYGKVGKYEDSQKEIEEKL